MTIFWKVDTVIKEDDNILKWILWTIKEDDNIWIKVDTVKSGYIKEDDNIWILWTIKVDTVNH